MPITNPANQCRVCGEFDTIDHIHDRPPQSNRKGICTTCLISEYRRLKSLAPSKRKQHGKKKA